MSDSTPIQDNALEFFREIVEPTVTEFIANPADKRSGVLASLVLASMTEHFFHVRIDGKKSDFDAFKLDSYNANGAVEWNAGVANATRHFKRLRKHRAIGLGEVQAMEMGRCGVLRTGWPIGGEEVLVGTGCEWRLSALIECAMEFWRDELGLPVAAEPAD